MFTHHTAHINGIDIHYVSEGTGPLILFAHGFPEFWLAWKEQLKEFGKDHQAVALDMRGYNLTEKPQEVEQYRVSHLVEDLSQLITHLAAEKCVLVAHDWGGSVSWVFAMIHPEQLEKLVIVNAVHPAVFRREMQENPAQQQASQYMLALRRPDAEKQLDPSAPSGDLGGAPLTSLLSPEDLAAYQEAWAQPGALTGALNYYRASRLGPPSGETSQHITRQMPLISVPTLVIWGEKDEALLPGNLNGLDQYVTNLTIKRIPDGSHWVIHEQPEVVNAAIRDFIQHH
jgi:pimeloyl-ACP methyl ester carboxylesterase